MSFLDNLENSLKSLENREEADASASERRTADRARQLALRPWAEQLRSSLYVQRLMDEAALRGHQLRAKVYMAWLDDVLRLEAKGCSCELQPTETGILARYQRLSDNSFIEEAVALESDSPTDLLSRWLNSDVPGASQPAQP